MNILIKIVTLMLLTTFFITTILIKQKTNTYDKYIGIFLPTTLLLSLVLLTLFFCKILF